MELRMYYNMLLKVVFSSQRYAKTIGVKIGKGCFISTKNFSSEPYLIEIGDNVRIAKNVSFFTHGGVWTLRKKYNKEDLDYFGKIKIKNNTYIGDSVIILPGVTIGENCIIGAGSVISKSVPDNIVVAGNPAIHITNTNDFVNKIDKVSLSCKNMTLKEKEIFLLKQNNNKFIMKPNIRIKE